MCLPHLPLVHDSHQRFFSVPELGNLQRFLEDLTRGAVTQDLV
jgi:hypothetical protein